ncbi:hypothetical protein DSM07_05440 [Oenococcus sp. UCMA 16435]|nr:hypothetical protein DSM07_05440 [Oenococcus sp. UCMA 16435]MDI4585255.1 hypothetical protein [Oenococcus sp. UCMA 14587]
MNKKIEIIKKYFRLSDIASNNNYALEEIIDLFSEQAIIKNENGKDLNKHSGIIKFFKDFFKRNQELKHICNISTINNQYKAEWSVAGEKYDQSLFALHGFDYYKFDNDNKITFLQIKII